jgi:L-cysteine:1D-myo-inositol 2-amino-2-deoxy-alpha-D-glucopyranoside ligase
MIKLSGRPGSSPIEFRPAGREARIYVCGITPYDASHLGHVATFMTYDVMIRRLRQLGYDTRMVRNITDLDDPIAPKVRELQVEYFDLVDGEIAQFRQDMDQLGMIRPDVEPRVSELIPEVHEFIGELTANGYTYQIDDVLYFDTARAKNFGAQSGFADDLLIHYARERGGQPDNPKLRNRLDFVLWRPSREAEPQIQSPYGAGMPGWHIGCSTMLRKYFGESVDLHGGGIDLVFPHHEGEAAQTMALQDEPFVRTWHRCEFVSYQGAKMSKSLGNIVLARDLLARHEPGAVRLAILRHYRYTAGFEWRDRDIAAGERLLAVLRAAARRPDGPDPRPFEDAFYAAIDDDLDFPGAVDELESLAHATLSGGSSADAGATLRTMAATLGVDLTTPA